MRSIVDKREIGYIAGRPYPKVSPKRRHSAVQVAMVDVLRGCAAGSGFVGTEWRFHLTPDTTLVPDVAYVSYDRLRILSDDDTEEPPFSPRIAVEVRSHSDRQTLIDEKTHQYLQYGSQLVLNVDPDSRTLTAHSNDERRACGAAAKRFIATRFPGCVLTSRMHSPASSYRADAL